MGMKDHQISFQGANGLDRSVIAEDAIVGLLVPRYLKHMQIIILEDRREISFG